MIFTLFFFFFFFFFFFCSVMHVALIVIVASCVGQFHNVTVSHASGVAQKVGLPHHISRSNVISGRQLLNKIVRIRNLCVNDGLSGGKLRE